MKTKPSKAAMALAEKIYEDAVLGCLEEGWDSDDAQDLKERIARIIDKQAALQLLKLDQVFFDTPTVTISGLAEVETPLVCDVAHLKRPKDMTFDELDALPLMSDMEAGIGGGFRGDDILDYVSKDGRCYPLQLGEKGWYRSTGIA